MADFEELCRSAPEGPRTVRLFPLPNLVLFPHVVQPLHIFEARYREMLRHALAGDQLIAMAVLSPGWEKDYEGRPPIGPMACLGKVVMHHRLEGGEYNVLLAGVKRVRLVRELPPAKPYREAEVMVCDDCYPAEHLADVPLVKKQIQQAFLEIVPTLPQAQDQVDQLFGSDVSLGTLTDIVSYLLDIDLREKEALLAELDVYRRAQRVLEHLRRAAADDAPAQAGPQAFPPTFSPN